MHARQVQLFEDEAGGQPLQRILLINGILVGDGDIRKARVRYTREHGDTHRNTHADNRTHRKRDRKRMPLTVLFSAFWLTHAPDATLMPKNSL